MSLDCPKIIQCKILLECLPLFLLTLPKTKILGLYDVNQRDDGS